MKKNKINVFIEDFLNSKVNLGVSLIILVMLSYFLFFL